MLGMLCIRSATAAVMIMAYNWRTNRNHRQHRQQQHKQLFRHWSSDPWLLRSADMTAADGIDIVGVRQKCLLSVVRCYLISIHDTDYSCGMGTGFRVANNNIGNDKYVVTAAHTAKGAQILQLAMIYENQYQYIDATVVYVELHRDLALFKLNIDESVDTDGYIPVPILTNNRPDFGEPVITFAINDWDFWCHSGRVQAMGVNNNQIMNGYAVEIAYIDDAVTLLAHSAPTPPGFSGGPLVVAGGQIAGANDIATMFGRYYGIAYNEINDFIENAINYQRTVFPRKVMNREIKYSPIIAGIGPLSEAAAVVVKLGIVLSKHINWFIVEDILPESLCPELSQKYIIAIDDQPFTNISQLTAAVLLTTGANDSNNRKQLKLTVIDLPVNDNNRMDTPLMVKCQHYSQLPVVF
ncbi:uncharacterized protein LOC128955132 [Oppia nitens]|uniref:uncharacterized protein LOC128955132 n=1 Tax=Oppia nitens TaxID=1686743 RepID=UPI0023D9A678|nr:uncharacterized protein LOC128955132 [Oppia nitens]